MEEIKSELGHIYGSRISKNGKWLNLIISTNINGENWRITCPVRMEENQTDGKPFSKFHLKSNAEIVSTMELDKSKAMILYIPVYEDAKPKQQAPANADNPFAKADGELPF